MEWPRHLAEDPQAAGPDPSNPPSSRTPGDAPPALDRCEVCRKSEDEHEAKDHQFARDESLPPWHGWHAFRRGLGSNLHDLGIDDETIQRILRHADLPTTQRCYIKKSPRQVVAAMAKLEDGIQAELPLKVSARVNKKSLTDT